MKTIQQRHDQVQEECLRKIKSLRGDLDRIENAIVSGLKLTEVVNIKIMLEARLGALAALRGILSDEGKS